jgi:hypothetical protein
MSKELDEDKTPIATGTFGMVHRAQLNGVGPVVIKRSNLLLLAKEDRLARCDERNVPLIHNHPFTYDLSREAYINMLVSRKPHPHIVRMIGVVYKCVGAKHYDVTIAQGLVFERWSGTYGQLLQLAHGRGRGDQTIFLEGAHALPGRTDVAAWLRVLLRVLLDALLGLRHLHSLGYAHCDLSLGNVLWRPRWGAGIGSGAVEGAIADLGTATSVDSTNHPVKSSRESHLYHLPGAHEMRGPQTDVFSVGTFLYAIGTRSTELCNLSVSEDDEEFATAFPDAHRPDVDVQFADAYMHADRRTQDCAARLCPLSLSCIAPLQKRITMDALCAALDDLLRSM